MITFPSFTSARSNRKALTGQLPDDVRSVEAQFSLCDDFLPQSALASDIGLQFSDAWFGAHQVIDLRPACLEAEFRESRPADCVEIDLGDRR